MTENMIRLIVQCGSLGVLAWILWILWQIARKELPEWRNLLTNHLSENSAAMTKAADHICESVKSCERFRIDMLGCLQRIEKNGKS